MICLLFGNSLSIGDNHIRIDGKVVGNESAVNSGGHGAIGLNLYIAGAENEIDLTFAVSFG